VTYLLDTNVLSEVRKPRRDPNVDRWLASTRPSDLFVSVLTLGEIRRGIERLRVRDAAQSAVFETWLGEVETVFDDRVLDVDGPVARTWGRISASDRLPAVDGLLAATALNHGLVVVSRDTRPFERVGVPWLDPWAYGQP
jgi:predicted nucleic acid-binding protein